MAKLFEQPRVEKFFNILSNFSSSIPRDKESYRYNCYPTVFTKDSKHSPSEREVFVFRTVAKWLQGKFLIIYRESDIGSMYKEFAYISMIRYENDWGGGHVAANLINYPNFLSQHIFNSNDLNYNNTIALEGEWCEDGKMHAQIADLFKMDDVPMREFIFRGYNWAKYSDDIKDSAVNRKNMEEEVSIFARTKSEANRLKDELEKKNNKNTHNEYYIGELIKVIENEDNA